MWDKQLEHQGLIGVYCERANRNIEFQEHEDDGVVHHVHGLSN